MNLGKEFQIICNSSHLKFITVTQKITKKGGDISNPSRNSLTTNTLDGFYYYGFKIPLPNPFIQMQFKRVVIVNKNKKKSKKKIDDVRYNKYKLKKL